MIMIKAISNFDNIYNYQKRFHTPYFFEQAYLRWIYVNQDITGKGIGTKCMNALKQWLWKKGVKKLDTDTAISNLVAQHYYEKNDYIREGVTKSYYR